VEWKAFESLEAVGSRHAPTVEWHEMKKAMRLLEEKRKELSLFQRYKAKWAWALVYVTNLMHKSKVLHNDLSPWNIMFHYPD